MDSSGVICPSCGRENPADSRFCSACGAPLAAGTWLDLAEILRAAGKAEAPAAAQEALTLYERKGNLVGASRAIALLDAAT